MLYAADAILPPPCPPDPNEQAMLTTYIHYRKMLIYAAQGKTTQAGNEYLVLNQLASWHPAYPFKELANDFWKEYQASQNLGTACSKTRENVHDNYDVFADSIGMS